MSSYLCYPYLATLKSQAELRFATAHLGFGLFANRLQVGEFVRLANMAPKRTRNAVESSASSAERGSPKKKSFTSQIQKWVQDGGVGPEPVATPQPAKRKAAGEEAVDAGKSTKFYKLKDWCVSS